MAKDKNFEKSGVEKPIRTGAKPVKKPMLKSMSDKTASEAGRWSPRSGDNWSAPEPGTRYNPPPAERVKGAATMSDNSRAKELLKSDFSNRADRSGKFFK